jgi:hypothetical protein
MQSQWKLCQLELKTWGIITYVRCFPSVAVLNWRVLDMAYAGASLTVTVEDQRSYIKIGTLSVKKKTYRISHCLVWNLWWSDRGPQYSFSLGYWFSWKTCRHKRWHKARKVGKNTDERSVKLVADFLAEDRRATCEEILQSTGISPKSVFRILPNICRKEKFVPDEPHTASLPNRHGNAWK